MGRFVRLRMVPLYGEDSFFAVGQKLVYILDINGEGLLFDEAGCPVQGITNVNSGFDRAMGNREKG